MTETDGAAARQATPTPESTTPESTTPESTTPESTAPPTWLFGPRGRHRRPRPRKVLLAAGGLALVAGALSLVRLHPGAGLGGSGTPEAAPWPSGDPGAEVGTERATNAAATVTTNPEPGPSATSAMGGLTATPTASPSGVPAPRNSPAVREPSDEDPVTTIPEAPDRPAAPQQPGGGPTQSQAPQQPPAAAPPQAPAPSQSAPPPAQQPTPAPSGDPGVCLPIVGLCVDPLGPGLLTSKR
ncbi:hypothetical protein [Streptomyces sp. DI166]|uniref:hypothetical protein n=1 Tax=Streptomyces sp. DI166 TaxID=1839783 RepID=UPI00210058F1|nr:hypothetical protein [Streptomyces sp. DI166]